MKGIGAFKSIVKGDDVWKKKGSRLSTRKRNNIKKLIKTLRSKN